MEPTLKFRAQVDFKAKTRCRPILVGQAVQAHHDYLGGVDKLAGPQAD